MANKHMKADQSYPKCCAILDDSGRSLWAEISSGLDYEGLLAQVEVLAAEGRFPSTLHDLLSVEHAFTLVQVDNSPVPKQVNRLILNPSLKLVPVKWSGLDRLLVDPEWNCQPAGPQEIIMVWRHPVSGKVEVKQATVSDLLALKIVSEELSASSVASEGGVAVGVVDAAIANASASGIVIKPLSAIRRHQSAFRDHKSVIDPAFLTSEVFSVQWHITQNCDLHCKHCYDRSSRGVMPLDTALSILDDIRSFCRDRNVHGQVTFSGGNPLLYPYFMELYQAAVDRYLGVAILGNPTSLQEIKALAAIAKPLYFQVSLEGLESHNDYIRGQGHFARVIEFLPVLKECGIYSMVMLTLTRDNQQQVLPLAELLRDKVDYFTFNRLAMVGEGATLLGAEQESFRAFLNDYLHAARTNPCMGLKDNLFNLLCCEQGRDLFGGCAGHGCGAAFNFVAIVADGEVHACRKFPSPIGNVFTESLAAAYDSDKAEGYRSGSAGCVGCRIRPVCGGCLAVSYGLGLDPLEARDPYCWRPA
ncbi:MAG: selenobiotic family peptide radical SAM maturase [Desulfobulbaceae bacterium]|nr:selenobiotic family peptide radical SAM maturase [Desulfobulbaceae bacterium]